MSGNYDYETHTYTDPYHNPSKFDLKIIEETEKEPCYDFDMVILWEHVPTGKKYWARDSGCSCPSPFENYRSIADLTELTRLTKPQYEAAKAEVLALH